MIIKNICLLLEALSVVICLHHLYGEKFQLDIETICLLAIDMIMMQAIDYFGLSGVWSVLIFPIIAVYCAKKFGLHIKKIIINIVLCVVIIGIVQLIVSIPICYLLKAHFVSQYILLMMNCLAFLIVTFILDKCKISRLSYMLSKEKLLIISLAICIAITAFFIVNYKKIKWLELNQGTLLLISIVLISVLSGQLGLYKVKAKTAEAELKMHKLYSDSFTGLIENIRLRQHEFDNHINTIYSQHYIYKTYDELVNAQKNYCQLITNENHFNKLLSSGNSIIIGFLYGKFIEIDKLGIEVTYKVNITDMKVEIPVYKIVEILGDLVDNAIDALVVSESYKKIHVTLEGNDNLLIEVRNESVYINQSDINNFFMKGYSKKGENRGLGLYNVKQICNDYRLKIICENIKKEGQNWLSFIVKNEKEPIN